jgi:microcin C transport system permease protein
MQLNPLTVKKWRRFQSIKRGYYSFVIFVVLIVLSIFSEVLVNSRALVVKYNDQLYFPTYGAFMPGTTFGLEYKYETNFRQLQKKFQLENSGNWVLMPIIPYNAYENDLSDDFSPPQPPNFEKSHYMGTDTIGRDVAARLVYGFRIAIAFSLFLLVANYSLGIAIGCAMGYFGGKFDLIFQRIIEIWSNVPFLYVVMIISSIMLPNFWSLIGIMMIFGWMGITWYIRTSTYKEKAREYSHAARAVGCNDTRIMFHHIIPNSVSIIVTFIPFAISSGIVSLTSLDYLGFGLPAPTPSWGELLSQGTSYMDANWILMSVVSAMIVILTMVTFAGEAVREAFDPKKHTTYE